MSKPIKFTCNESGKEEVIVGRTDSTHLSIAKDHITSDCVKIGVVDTNGILFGFAFAGNKPAGGYEIHRFESWSKRMCGGEVAKWAYRLLSDSMFDRLIKSAA